MAAHFITLVLSMLVVAFSELDPMHRDMVAGAGTHYPQELLYGGSSQMAPHFGFDRTVGEPSVGRYSASQLGAFGSNGNSYQERQQYLQSGPADVLARFNEEQQSVLQGLSDAQAKLRWASEQLHDIVQHEKPRPFLNPDAFQTASSSKAQEDAFAQNIIPTTAMDRSSSMPLQHNGAASRFVDINAQEDAFAQNTIPFTAMDRWSSLPLQHNRAASRFVDMPATSGLILVDNSLCTPSCQFEHAACVQRAGRLLEARSCVCIPPYTGPSCAEREGLPVTLALTQTKAQTWRERNPALGALFFEPVLYGLSAFQALAIFCASLFSFLCMQASKSQHANQPVANEGGINNAAQNQHNDARHSRLSSFFQYPGGALNRQCASTPAAANHADEEEFRRRTSARRQEVWRPIAKNECPGKDGYVDDESDVDAESPGRHGVVN